MVLYFLMPLALSALVTPLIIILASRNGLLDKPGLHKTHHKATPLLGGIAIYVACLASYLVLFELGTTLLSLFAAAFVLLIVGLVDDLNNIRPWTKLTGQVAVASIVVFFNTDSLELFFSYFQKLYLPPVAAQIITVGLIVLLINAFNLIDGLDGLAAGTAAIIFGFIFLIDLFGGDSVSPFPLVGLGACLGFLFYNFHPAKIFMGDTGSMFIGFFLIVTYLFSIEGPFSISLLLGSVCIFAYPLLDVFFAIFRRLLRGGRIFTADQEHIHHILRRMGFSIRSTVIILYLISIIAATLGIFFLVASPAGFLAMFAFIMIMFLTLGVFAVLNHARLEVEKAKEQRSYRLKEIIRSNIHSWF